MRLTKSNVAYYVDKFRKLKKDRSAKRYVGSVQYSAPHKPFLLLTVCDLFAEKRFSENLITLTPEMIDLFQQYWLKLMPAEVKADISLPFFYLKSEGFWHLQARSGSEIVLEAGRVLRSVRQLHDHTKGARLDDELFELLQDADIRELLRRTLIETHFSADVHEQLLTQGEVNQAAFEFSRLLLEQAKRKIEIVDDALKLSEPVRDQGFRHAVVSVYEHRCALCGISVRTSDNHTVVDAAHIIPWRVSQNDALRNGVALCKLCHWVFDEGLVTISSSYKVLISDELTAPYNSGGYLLTLEGQKIYGPQSTIFNGDTKLFWPDITSLEWHKEHVFRG